MNDAQREELLFEIRNRVMNIESTVLTIAKYLAHLEDALIELLQEKDRYEKLIEELEKEKELNSV